MQQRTSYIFEDIRRFKELQVAGYTNDECAWEIGCSAARCSQFKAYLMAVEDEAISPFLARVIEIHNSEGRPSKDFFSFDGVYALLGIRQEYGDGIAEHYSEYEQEAALQAALKAVLPSAAIEDASDNNLRLIRFSDFKQALRKAR